MNTQKYIFHVHGMHCNACTLLIESELRDLPYVTYAKASIKNHSVEVEGNFEGKTPEQIAKELTLIVTPRGYTISAEKQIKGKGLADFKIAVPIALAFLTLFVVLQKIGLVNLAGSGDVTLGVAFVIGIIASLSTCMAVVGGLLLSMSATFAKEGDRMKPQLLFHGGRIISFFVFGGIIGLFGTAFTLNTSTTFILSLVIGLVMFILGINLLDVFHFTKRLQLSMPKFVAKRAHAVSKFNHTGTPFLAGIATFFLPCGFTQSMQLYTLTTGGFLKGGLTMLSFALGTLPVLALISFSSFSIQNNKRGGVFFKTAGIIVIMFALLNIINSLAIIGIMPPIFNF